MNGELQCLWVSVKVARCKFFSSEASHILSCLNLAYSSTAKGALQIYPSGGFRPVFSFVLGFLVLFFVVSILFYFFKFLSGSVVNHLLVLLLYVGHNNFKSRFC